MIIAMHPPELSQSTTALSEGSKLLLWCLRRWVSARLRGRNPGHPIKMGLKAYGLGSAHQDFECLMQAICRHARGLIDIRPGAAVQLSSDEVIVCRAFEGTVEHPELVCARLKLLLHEPGLQDAVQTCQSIAAAWHLAGLDFSIKSDRVNRPSDQCNALDKAIARL